MANTVTRGPEIQEKLGSNSQVLGYFSLKKKEKELVKETAVCHSCYWKVATKHGNTRNYVLTHLCTSHGKLYSEP